MISPLIVNPENVARFSSCSTPDLEVRRTSRASERSSLDGDWT